jgi:septum formation protein
MIYLASQSPRRRQLLRELRQPFRTVRSSYRESIRPNETPSQNAMRNAAGKARAAQLPPSARGVVIGADTFLYFRGRIIGKPRTMAHARRLMRELSGRSHWVYTGLALRDIASGRVRRSVARSRVMFKQLDDEAIARLFRRAHPLDKAGGYALQADRGELIARITGSRTNVVGLPLELLREELRVIRGGKGG